MCRSQQPADHCSDSFAVLGVLSRVDQSLRETCVRELAQLQGVSLFDVDDPQRIGILIEQPTLAEAESVLLDDVQSMRGVLGAWPVFVHVEEPE